MNLYKFDIPHDAFFLLSSNEQHRLGIKTSTCINVYYIYNKKTSSLNQIQSFLEISFYLSKRFKR